MKPSNTFLVLGCILLSTFLVRCWAVNNVRWCRSRVNSCSKKLFTAIVDKKFDEIQKTLSTGPSATNPIRASTVTAAVRRKREVDEGPAALRVRRGDSVTTETDAATDDVTATPTNGGGEQTPNPTIVVTQDIPLGHASTVQVTTTQAATTTTKPTTTTEIPSLPLGPPKVYRPDDWDETFFKCLDEWRKKDPERCRLFTAQRCNWNDGMSPIIARYCRKWSVPCKPCELQG